MSPEHQRQDAVEYRKLRKLGDYVSRRVPPDFARTLRLRRQTRIAELEALYPEIKEAVDAL